MEPKQHLDRSPNVKQDSRQKRSLSALIELAIGRELARIDLSRTI